MREAVPDGKFSVMPNAGWPQQVGGRIMYPAEPEYFGEYALSLWNSGADVLGGCCGTTPEHIAAMTRALESAVERANSEREAAEMLEPDEPQQSVQQTTGLGQKLAEGRFVVAVEMDPPRGYSTHKLLAAPACLPRPARM